jgi:hypothetical protein
VGDAARTIFETDVPGIAAKLDKALLLLGEILINLDVLPGFLGAIRKLASGEVLFDIQVVDRGLALVMLHGLDDAGGLPPVVRHVPATLRTSELALRFGGRPYGIGIWNTPLAGRVMGKGYCALKTIKRETDRLGILNPGKFFGLTTGSGLPVWGGAYRLGMRMIKGF